MMPNRIFALIFLVTTLASLAVSDRAGVGADAALEVARVRAHIFGAERLAARRDISHLPWAARMSRARLLRVLRAYREHGRFPKNRDFPGRRVPYFVDREGTRCAMAYLIESTGDSELVARISRSQNNAYVRDLAGDPDVVAWLGRSGLTLDEAARIQPAYGYAREHNPAALEPPAIAGVMALESAGILLNLDPPQTNRAKLWRGGFAISAGFGGMLAGFMLVDEPGDLSPGWGASCFTLGVVSLVHGAHRLARPIQAPPGVQAHAGIWRSAGGVPGVAVCVQF